MADPDLRRAPLPRGPLALLRHVLFEAEHQPLATRLLCYLAARTIYFLVACIGCTLRVRVIHRERERALRSRDIPVIYAGWHQTLFTLIWHWRWVRGCAMASRSQVGEIVDYVIRLTGSVPCRGGSAGRRRQKGGREALEEMAERMRRFHQVGALLLDATQGPPRRAKWGALDLARRTGFPILPYAADAWPRLLLPTWDRTMIPLPFGELRVIIGEPYYVPAETDKHDLRRRAAELGEYIETLERELAR